MRYAICALLCVTLAATSAYASGAEQALESTLELDSLERAAQENGGGAELSLDSTLEDNLSQILQAGKEQLAGALKPAVRSGVLLLAIVLLCSLGDGLANAGGEQKLDAVPLAGALGVTAVVVTDVNAMMGLGRTAIGSIGEFSNVLLPIVAAVTAATGAIAGAASRQMAAAIFSKVLIDLIGGVLIPLLYCYIAAGVAWTAVGNEGLRRIGSLFKWAVVTVLTIVMLAYVGYLTLSGVVSGSADAASVKAARFAISGAVPVVGGILADASESVLAAAGTLRGTIGTFGMVTVLAVCLVPFLRLAVHYLVYKLCAALAATVDNGRVSGLIDMLSGAFGLILGMMGACALVLLVFLVSSVSMVTV